MRHNDAFSPIVWPPSPGPDTLRPASEEPHPAVLCCLRPRGGRDALHCAREVVIGQIRAATYLLCHRQKPLPPGLCCYQCCAEENELRLASWPP